MNKENKSKLCYTKKKKRRPRFLNSFFFFLFTRSTQQRILHRGCQKSFAIRYLLLRSASSSMRSVPLASFRARGEISAWKQARLFVEILRFIRFGVNKRSKVRSQITGSNSPGWNKTYATQWGPAVNRRRCRFSAQLYETVSSFFFCVGPFL